MRSARALVAADPRRFGRARSVALAERSERRWTVSDDLQLFAATFAGGFVFVSILIG